MGDLRPSLLKDRARQFIFALNKSQVIVMGGVEFAKPVYDVTQNTAAVELYDYRTGQTKSLATSPFSIYDAIQLTDGRVLACESLQCALYQPAEDRWIEVQSRSQDYSGFLVALGDGRALGGDGRTSLFTSSKGSAVFDPRAGSWQRVGDMNIESGSRPVRLRDGRVLVTGATASDIFDPTQNRWTPAAAPPPSYGGTMLLLPDGRVLTVNFRRAAIYDPPMDQWIPVGNLSSADLGGSTMSLLPNGLVLIAGGTALIGDTYRPIANTGLFDPRTLKVRPGPSLALPRSDHAAVAMPDGEVLLAGGYVTRTSITSAVESFAWEPSFTGTLDAGFYIATATQAEFGEGGVWGLEVHSSGPLDGGLNFGGFLDALGRDVGFGAFFIAEPQTVSASLNLQFAPTPDARGGGSLAASLRLLDVNKQVVAGSVAGLGHLEMSKDLQPGFYVLEMRTDPDRGNPAAFQLALNAPRLQAGGSAGALLDRGAGVSGFVAFYLASRQDVTITLFNQNTYGWPRGAGEAILTLKDSTGKVLFQSGPGVEKLTR